jgi:hypothetical protein
MNGEKNILNNVVDPIRLYALVTCDTADQRRAIPEQPLVRDSIANLGGCHELRPVQIELCRS